MASKIRLLDENTINQIAAGEVIENPASVVKELVDNSIDSGADEITVEICGGGRQLIRVTDNGCGMSPDDAVLCLERHATSKIQTVDDILRISSRGFRGEAIPSMASISKFTLLTSPEEGIDKGTMVIVEGGRIIKVCEAVRGRGTTIEVKSLFYNVPVRRKFQRSPNYDSGEILKILVKLALANPEIKIELIGNQKLLLETKRATGESLFSQLSSRVADVLGEEFVHQCCSVENVCEGIEVCGVIGLPLYTRHNRTGQHLFINRRPVFSPIVHHAVREGYSTTLPANRHPLFVLHIQMPGDLVDINVHPQKKEVRLRQEQLLKRAVTQAVDKALHNSETVALSFDSEAQPIIFDPPTFGSLPWMNESIFAPEEPFRQPPSNEITFLASTEVQDCPPRPLASHKMGEEPTLFSLKQQVPNFKLMVIGTIPGYILLDGTLLDKGEGSLCLIDQKAAHARVLFEALLQKDRCHPIEVQQLLVPLTLELTQEESALLSQNSALLTDLGIGVKEFGRNCFIIDALSPLFGEIDAEAFIYELIHSLGKGEEGWLEGEIERKLAALASRLALSRSTKMGIEEAQHLVAQLFLCKHPYQSPTGQPTLTSFDSQELAKRF